MASAGTGVGGKVRVGFIGAVSVFMVICSVCIY